MKGYVLATASLVVAITCGGCGGPSWMAATHPVEGVLKVNGEPAAGAVVTIYPTGEKVDERNTKPWGIVDESGKFQLQSYKPGDGAPAGEYDVTIQWPWDVHVLSLSMTDRLGGKFQKPQQSQWRITVSEGTNQLDPIEIEGAKVEMTPPSKNAKKRIGPPGPRMGP
ncbi:hypothetical protein Pan216_28340 [Planctomycetes bacterium Pan216]|uniref:Nickel uptake substrate-specific transmembrane region n=1 Tax=Kolteria novifilia TaxID=2527975 RepID=A0A518B4Q9_9BACT|nr:hypothetical protein Pan216_28340 [Planctomycetes bacterium Pan216]